MMETIKVNMNPNPLDVQTIHASQNDGEAREWGFELHNNGELIDTSNVTEQLFFKAYKGGTEQILPENGSTPTTAPIIADIQYPQGLLTDQSFTYRQSPSEEDGIAKFTSIKGNTLGWNQLVPPLSAMSGQNGTLSVADNVVTITSSSSVNYLGIATSGSQIVLPIGGHKYLLTSEINPSKALSNCNLWYGNSINAVKYDVSANTWTKVSSIVSYSSPTGQYVQFRGYGSFEQGDTMQVRNWNYFDLTAMGLDSITTIEEFTTLFPLPFYDYNQGTLIPFSGNGIKTVGFNLFDQDSVLTNVGFVEQSDGSFYIQYPLTANYKVLFENKLKYNGQFFLVYKFKYANTTSQGCRFEIHYTDGTIDQVYAQGSSDFVEISFTSRANKVVDYISATYGSNIGTWWKDVCINISDLSKNGTYEPYTEITTDLPISTYFPAGMKSAGTVYDELTENKAITRIGAVDLGTLTWTYDTSVPRFYTQGISSIIKKPLNNDEIANITTIYKAVPLNGLYNQSNDKCIAVSNGGVVSVKDTSYSDLNAFRTAMSNVYLYYELATPTETSFTTASLVTENAEIPLSNEDGVLIGKCTEQLSAEPGFHDAKIKLSDGDGTCYSNKIQLHVERKPS